MQGVRPQVRIARSLASCGAEIEAGREGDLCLSRVFPLFLPSLHPPALKVDANGEITQHLGH